MVAEGGRYTANGLALAAGETTDIDIDTAGVTVGAHSPIGKDKAAGIAVSYLDNKADSADARAKARGHTVVLQGYGSWTPSENWRVKAGLAYAYQSDDVDLTTPLEPAKAASARVKQHAVALGAAVERPIRIGSVTVTPHAGAELTWVKGVSFDTRIDGATAFTNDRERIVSAQLPVGVSVATHFKAGGWALSPKADITVAPRFGRTVDTRVSATGTDKAWTVSNDIAGKAAVTATVGLTAQNGDWTVGAQYGYNGADKSRKGHVINLKANYAF